MQGKSLKIEFIKVNTKEIKLIQEERKDLEERIEQIEALFIQKMIGLQDDELYIELCNKADTSRTDVERNCINKEKEKYYEKKAEAINKERNIDIRNIESAVYGRYHKDENMLVNDFDTDFDIRCIRGFSYNELKVEREKLINSMCTINTSFVSFCPFLLLDIIRLKDSDNYKEQLKVDIIKLIGEGESWKEEYNGTIFSYMSELEKNLLDLIDYGVELSRQEITEIRRIIKSNYDIIDVEEVDFGDELKLSYICEYIDENGIGITKVNKDKSNEKPLYLIPSKDFDKEFKGYKNTVDLMGRLIKESIVEVSRGRRRYKYTDKDYYIAIKADNDTVIKLMKDIQGSEKGSKDNDKADDNKQVNENE